MAEPIFNASLLNTGLFLLIIFVTFIISFVVNFLIVKLLKSKVEPSAYKFISRISTYIIFIAGLTIGFNRIVQINLGATLATLGILGGLLLLPAIPVLQNLASGFILSFERPFKEEDYIEVNGKICKVKEVNLRKTVLRSLSGEMIIVPNLMFMTGTPVVNYTVGEFIKISQTIEVLGNSDLSKTKQIIEKVCSTNTNILPNIPQKKKNALQRLFNISHKDLDSRASVDKLKPRVFIKFVSKDKIVLETWFWIWDMGQREQIVSNFYESIIEEFGKNKIKLA